MSIQKVIQTAYKKAKERNWDSIYWCIDLHDTCLKSTYESQMSFDWINEDCKETLRLISSLPESKIILWSSCSYHAMHLYKHWFQEEGVEIFDLNNNYAEENTSYANFDSKFYFSIGIDDKFGFDPETDWKVINDTLKNIIQ